ncbi:MAG TPA: T9SS type A sorting domain-containing protein [Chitinophagaceae bacterium]|nr:T9SS type A sorting domain-containing protein [Chitinophagaceae bacterium]
MKAILFSITALLSAAALHAQTDLQNNGTLFVSGPSTILYVNGSFNNASGAALTNNGNFYVLQNINNAQAAMATGTGTLYLSGSALQSVAGTQPFKTFNLVTNNAAGITLNNDVSVSGIHTFTAGVLSSSVTPNYLIYEAGASYTGDADTRHVKGWVTKNGNTAFVFPVGNGTVERTIAINALSAASVFNANYAGATTNTGNLASPLVTVDPNEYWIVNKVSGGTATIGMNWDNSKIAMPPYLLTNIRVANYTGGLWTQAGSGATGNVATTGTISSNTLSAFGPFTFGSLSFALPVHLLQFSASILNQNALVKWTTSDEINVHYYEVQRSDDGFSFYTIGQLPARNLTAVQQYSFTDTKALNTVTYYRLKSVDTDGKTKLSDIVTLNSNTITERTMAVANPAHSSLHVTASNLSGDFEYRINTLSGQTLQQGILHLAGSGSYEIYLSPVVKNAMYILQVQKAGFNFTRKILVQ